MDVDPAGWPVKMRELHNHHFDSTIWNDFEFRDYDIVIATYAKSGTTWLQQIVAQLLFAGAADLQVAEMSPWLDLRVPPKAEKLAAVAAQTHRRFIKTHLPLDALVYSHSPGRVGPPIGKPTEPVRRYFLDWLEQDGQPFWSFWDNVSTWWPARTLPNCLFLHFAALKADMPREIRRIAEFLGAPIDDDRWAAILEHCSFDWMKANATKSVPLGGAFWDGGATTFLHKGTNGRWRDVLTADDSLRYEAMARERLGEDCAR